MDTRLLTAIGPVTDQTAQAIRELVANSAEEIGVAPVSEQPLLWLQDPRAHVAHILAIRDNSLVGYAQVDLSSPHEVTLELAVYPSHPSLELERRLLEAGAYVAEQNEATYSVWIHGATDELVSMFQEHGFTVTRTLLRMGMDLVLIDDTPDPAFPADPAHNVGRGAHAQDSSTSDAPGVRTFDFERDGQSWVRANAAAFDWHPEQGKLTLKDLEARMREPWFDPDMFLVIDDETRTGELAGFSWLKVEPNSKIGEIYALASVPSMRGRGLGKDLLVASLELLLDRGCTRADLFVESDNQVAVELYESFGFEQVERHVLVSRAARGES